jgi:hypothetical protein
MIKNKIFLDMDGVVADFFGEITRRLGKKHYNELTVDEVFNFMNKVEISEFFRTLPEFKSNNILIDKIMKFTNGMGFYICSSPLMDDRESPDSDRNRYFIQQSIIGKKQWIDNHLHPHPIKICFSRDKWKDAPAVEDGIPNILIDDRRHNVEKWNEAGGIAIKFQADEHIMDGNLKFLDKELDKVAKIITSDKSSYSKVVESYLQKYKGI